jgi:hypothetical protein
MSIRYCPSCKMKKLAGRGYVLADTGGEHLPGATVLCSNSFHEFEETMKSKSQKKFWEKDGEIERYFGTAPSPNTSYSYTGSTETSTYTPCHRSHKPFKAGAGELFGGSCSNPRDGFDVYVSLSEQGEMVRGHFPWEPGPSPVQFKFPIQDMGVPKDTVSFKRMAEWLAAQLTAGKRVHIGCLGGHGRTGTLMAAIMAELGEKDPIIWVRKAHCKKAVESSEQVTMLVKLYGIPPAKGYKEGQITQSNGDGKVKYLPVPKAETDRTPDKRLKPVPSKRCIWKS